jgi:hypothetical protein
MSEENGKKEPELTVGDIASKLDSRLRFLEEALWNLGDYKFH